MPDLDQNDEFGPHQTLARRAAWMLAERPFFDKDLIPNIDHALISAALWENHQYGRKDCQAYLNKLPAAPYKKLVDDVVAELVTHYPVAARRFIASNAPMISRSGTTSSAAPMLGSKGDQNTV